jgi:rhamnosyltransferase
MEVKKFAILLSVFNGEAYLEDQITSIFNVHFDDVTLYIRDDGSQDRSPLIINKIANEFSSIILLPDSGLHLGIRASFMSLLDAALSTGHSLYAYCDQDDVWIGNRFEDSASIIDKSVPHLVISRAILTRRNLEFIGFSPELKPVPYVLSLFRNQAIGCCCVFNHKLATLVSKRAPDFEGLNILHDWITYILASVYGRVSITSNFWTLYRQHGENAVGISTGAKRILHGFIGRVTRRAVSSKQIAKALLKCNDDSLPMGHCISDLATFRVWDLKLLVQLVYRMEYKLAKPIDFVAIVLNLIL